MELKFTQLSKMAGVSASEFRLITIFTGFQIQSSPAISREQIENQPDSFGVKRARDQLSPHEFERQLQTTL
jgi:hypothetical protein